MKMQNCKENTHEVSFPGRASTETDSDYAKLYQRGGLSKLCPSVEIGQIQKVNRHLSKDPRRQILTPQNASTINTLAASHDDKLRGCQTSKHNLETQPNENYPVSPFRIQPERTLVNHAFLDRSPIPGQLKNPAVGHSDKRTIRDLEAFTMGTLETELKKTRKNIQCLTPDTDPTLPEPADNTGMMHPTIGRLLDEISHLRELLTKSNLKVQQERESNNCTNESILGQQIGQLRSALQESNRLKEEMITENRALRHEIKQMEEASRTNMQAQTTLNTKLQQFCHELKEEAEKVLVNGRLDSFRPDNQLFDSISDDQKDSEAYCTEIFMIVKAILTSLGEKQNALNITETRLQEMYHEEVQRKAELDALRIELNMKIKEGDRIRERIVSLDHEKRLALKEQDQLRLENKAVREENIRILNQRQVKYEPQLVIFDSNQHQVSQPENPELSVRAQLFEILRNGFPWNWEGKLILEELLVVHQELSRRQTEQSVFLVDTTRENEIGVLTQKKDQLQQELMRCLNALNSNPNDCFLELEEQYTMLKSEYLQLKQEFDSARTKYKISSEDHMFEQKYSSDFQSQGVVFEIADGLKMDLETPALDDQQSLRQTMRETGDYPLTFSSKFIEQPKLLMDDLLPKFQSGQST